MNQTVLGSRSAAAGERDDLYGSLVHAVLEKRRQPEDRYEIAAILESMGWNDDRVHRTFGLEDVFTLAEEIWDDIQNRVVYTPFAMPPKITLFGMTLEVVQSFLRGLIFALPMAISVLSMLTLRFSLWSSENLTTEIATSIAIGTILSFVTVGGFTQAIARRGFFYIYQDYYNMARRITFYFIRIGYLACALLSIALYFGNVVFNLYPATMFLMIVLYYFFLNSIWLSVTVMYLLRKEFTFTGLIILGIAMVYVLYKWMAIPIIQAQLVSVSAISIVGMTLAYAFFRREERRLNKTISPKLTRLSIMVYSVMPYFLYGILYFGFLYEDRVLSWSTNHPWDPMQQYMPYFLWMRGPYELGLDFALLVLMIPLGVIEVVVNNLMHSLEGSQKRFLSFDVERMNRLYRLTYLRMLAIVAISSLASAAIIVALVLYFNDLYFVYAGKYLIVQFETWFVFVVSLAAYGILAVGLLNAVIMFSLSQPGEVNKAMLLAVVVNTIFGFLLTRWVDYTWAVFGLLAGSLLFTLHTTRSMLRVFGKLDYYLYAGS